MREYVCAVDVGTGSARAGIFDRAGTMLARAEHPIAMNRPLAGHAEHDSEDIWRAVCNAVRAARTSAGIAAEKVAGLSFDATCSLVVRGQGGCQLGVSADGDARWDTIAWLDHRALAEADECTVTRHHVLDHIGGVMSPEMQTPKLMWLKRNRPRTWNTARYFFDLVDFLTWKASGSQMRSICSLTGKWTYLSHEDGWREDFFRMVGLADMLETGGLPDKATPVGTALGPLTDEAVDALGLDAGCIVGTGLIDAFAGALGAVGGCAGEDIDQKLALIAGTSSCVMGFSREARHVPGVWGPYFGAALPDYWLYEGGQSATGALLDHVIRLHGAGGEPDTAMHERITARIVQLRAADPDLGAGLHVLPDFHGNRSPFADPHARGVISGMTLDASFDGLCGVYWRSAVAIALGVRHILDHLNASGYRITTLNVSGGHTRNPLLMELYADATGCTVIESDAEDTVLLGTAMVAATAVGWHGGLADACRSMRSGGLVRKPNPALREAYERDYRIFLKMHDHRRELDRLGR